MNQRLYSMSRPSSLSKQNNFRKLIQTAELDYLMHTKKPIKNTFNNLEQRVIQSKSQKKSLGLPKQSNLEIQKYTNLLMQNNKGYQQQIFELKKQNTQLKSQYEKSIAETILIKTKYDEQIYQLKTTFNSQISNLINELKDILQSKQLMEEQYKQLIIEMNSQQQEQLSKMKGQMQKMQQIFKERLEKLTLHIDTTKSQSEKQYFQTSELKLSFLKQIDQLNFEIKKQRQQNIMITKQNQSLQMIIKKLQSQLYEIQDKYQENDISKYKKQQQKNSVIIDLKNTNKKLTQQINKLEIRSKQIQQILIQKQNYHQNYNSDVIQQYQIICQEKNKLDQNYKLKQSQLKNIIFQINDFKQQIIILEQEKRILINEINYITELYQKKLKQKEEKYQIKFQMLNKDIQQIKNYNLNN